MEIHTKFKTNNHYSFGTDPNQQVTTKLRPNEVRILEENLIK